MKSFVNITLIVLCLVSGLETSVRGGDTLHVLKIDTRSSAPDVSVSLAIKGLKSTVIDDADFSVSEDGIPADSISIKKEKNSNSIVYLVFSIDSSKSIPVKGLSNIKKYAKDIVDSADESMKIGLWKFDDDTLNLKDFTHKKDELIRAIDSITRQGKKTLLYNAIYDSIERLSEEEGSGKSIIVFTDGKDEGSGITVDDVVNFAHDHNVAVHFLTPSTVNMNEAVSRIAKRTGGIVYSIDDKGAGKRILRILRNSGDDRYTLRYRGNKTDQKARLLEIRFKKNEVRDRIAVQVDYPDTLIGRNIFIYAGLGLGAVAVIIAMVILFLVVRKKEYGITAVKEQKRIEKICPVSAEFFSRHTNGTEKADTKVCRGWLLEKEGPETGKKIPIFWKNVTVGRDPSNSIVVNDIAVSAKHVRIRFVKGAFYIIDLASENGSFLNNKKLLRVKKLSDWDEIKIGRTSFIFRYLNNRV